MELLPKRTWDKWRVYTIKPEAGCQAKNNILALKKESYKND